ncbi:MAG: hypothetical protein JHD05_06990 [Thermoleophilia bacterium]|jgi:hypothetical protein|nr:hypothetical protein [Thermoleophilia bacterium]MBJ7334347.1 hypothetical protein [Thermoleophilia bacterium]
MGTAEFATYGLISLIGYIIVGIRLMNLCNASGVSHGWLAFIPLLNFTRWARLAGKNPWLVLLWFVFVIPGLILSLIWLNKIAEKTGTKSPWYWVYLIATIITFAGTSALSGTTQVIVTLILTVAMIAAQWMIFDPTKGTSTTTATF